MWETSENIDMEILINVKTSYHEYNKSNLTRPVQNRENDKSNLTLPIQNSKFTIEKMTSPN